MKKEKRMAVIFPETYCINPDDNFSIVFPVNVERKKVRCVIEPKNSN